MLFNRKSERISVKQTPEGTVYCCPGHVVTKRGQERMVISASSLAKIVRREQLLAMANSKAAADDEVSPEAESYKIEEPEVTTSTAVTTVDEPIVSVDTAAVQPDATALCRQSHFLAQLIFEQRLKYADEAAAQRRAGQRGYEGVQFRTTVVNGQSRTTAHLVPHTRGTQIFSFTAETESRRA